MRQNGKIDVSKDSRCCLLLFKNSICDAVDGLLLVMTYLLVARVRDFEILVYFVRYPDF